MADVEPKIQQAIEDWAEGQQSALWAKLSVCESPVEQLLFMALVNSPLLGAGEITGWAGHYLAKDHAARNGFNHMAAALLGNCKWYLYSQFEMTLRDRGPIRLDFAIFSEHQKIAVEVDGHDWHERTKEQAERDKSRDRLLQMEGWKVFRFTGSEVWRDADACALDVLIALSNEPVEQVTA